MYPEGMVPRALRRIGCAVLARGQSFRYAFKGIGYIFRTQANAKIHLAITLLVIAAGWRLDIGGGDWLWLIISIAMVWAAEAFNTAIEYVCDVVSPEHHEAVERAKDIGAAAVLICACGAAVIGAIIFYPYL